MAHAGFPGGIGTSPEEVARQLSQKTNQSPRIIIIQLEGKPIGEMNYKNREQKTAEIGIKICDLTQQEKGYGTRALNLLIKHLFENLGYRKIILNTILSNTRAQHVYEKIGFVRTKVDEVAVYYELMKNIK